MRPDTVQVPLAGLYSSALATRLPLESSPPATRTCPSASRVAVCPARGKFNPPVAVQVPEACAKPAEAAANQTVKNTIAINLGMFVDVHEFTRIIRKLLESTPCSKLE